MKKIKLIAPILGATAALAPVMVLTSCGAQTIQMYKQGQYTWSSLDTSHQVLFNIKANETVVFKLINSSGNQGKTATLKLVGGGTFSIENSGKINNVAVNFAWDSSNSYWYTTIPSSVTSNIVIEVKVKQEISDCTFISGIY